MNSINHGLCGRRMQEELPPLQVFSQSGYHFVLNISTGVFYAVNQEVVDLISCLSEGTLHEIDGHKEGQLYQELQAAGLFSVMPIPSWEPNPPLSKIYLNVSARCNMCCHYCFANQGSYDGNIQPMRADIGEKAIDLLLHESGNRTKVHIIFFGGEPLLNRSLIKHLIVYGRRKSVLKDKYIHFTVVTNGTLLNSDMARLFAREKVTVAISLDGPPEVQNRLRSTIRGKPTYERVIKNIYLLKEYGVKNVGLHATLVSLNPQPVDILDHLASLDVGPIQLEFADPIQENREPWSITDLPTIKECQKQLVEYFLSNLQSNRLVPLGNILQPLYRLYRRVRVQSYCGAGVTMASVTPDGSLFPCFRFAENPDLACGSVHTGLDREKLRAFVENYVDNQTPCRTCWARYLCGGGCRYNNLLVTGAITQPAPHQCSVMKQWIEMMLYLFGRIHRELPNLIEKVEREGVLELFTYAED